MVALAFSPSRDWQISVSLRLAWSTEQSQDTQGYTLGEKILQYQATF